MAKFTAKPLLAYSSVHEISVAEILGKRLFITALIDFNLHTSPLNYPKTSLVFRGRDAEIQRPNEVAFSFTHMARWRVDVSKYDSFEDYVHDLSHSQFKNLKKTEEKFISSQDTLLILDGGWSEYAEEVYKLYSNVALKHPPPIYDLGFFREIAKRKEYKLIGIQCNRQLIGAAVLLEEYPTLHAICCGLDYHHSSGCNAYSYLHYTFLRIAIESKQFATADMGFTADEAKAIMGFKKIDAVLDVSVRNQVFCRLLRFISYFFEATITSDSKLRVRFRFLQKLKDK